MFKIHDLHFISDFYLNNWVTLDNVKVIFKSQQLQKKQSTKIIFQIFQKTKVSETPNHGW